MYAKVTDAAVGIYTDEDEQLAMFTINFIPEPGNNCGSYEVYDETFPNDPPVMACGDYVEIVGTICDEWLVQG